MVRRTRWAALAGATALAVSLPYWWSTRGAIAGVFWSRGASPSASSYLELFGVPVALAVVALVVTLVRGGGRTVTWSWLLVGMGFALILAPELITVSDRMNTVFKFHLQAHLLLACGLAGVIVGAPSPETPGWRWLLRGAVAIPIGIGLATAAGCVITVLATRRVAGPRPTLDGTRYLSVAFPEQAAVLERLAGTRPAGAVAEPPGTPYSDTLRVPMFTGQPAVVGWEYHLWQRRHSWSEIRVRQSDLDVLLGGVDDDVVSALARRYRLLGAVSWSGEAPAVARAMGWSRRPVAGEADVFLAGEAR